MNAMIFAAGFGTRLKPYSLYRPKPLFPVLGEPLLSLLLTQVQEAGFEKIIVNGHHLADQVGQLVEKHPEIIFQNEEIILGTGGGLRLARRYFNDDPLVVVNGDIVHDINLKEVYQFHQQSGGLVTMVMHDYPRFNTVHVLNDKVTGFSEALDDGTRGKLAFTGIHVLDPEILNRIPSKSFYNIIDLYKQLLLAGEEIMVYRADLSFWHDIGTPDDYLQLHGNLLHRRVILPWLQEILKDGSHSFPFIKGRGSNVDERQVQLSDWVCIGEDVHIDSGTRLERCVVWDGATVAQGEYLDAILY